MTAFLDIPVSDLPALCRSFLYAVLQMNRGRYEHALSFVRQAKETACSPEELAYVLFVEGFLFVVTGANDLAILRYKACAQTCEISGVKKLQADALLLLSSIYLTMGEPAMARVYEKEAAFVLPRKPVS